MYKNKKIAALNEGSMLFFQAAKLYVQSGGEAKYLDPLLAYFKHRRISKITRADLIVAGAKISDGKWNEDTIRRQVITPARAVINFALGNRTERRRDGRRKRWLTPEEFERLLQAAVHEEMRDPSCSLVKLLGFMVSTGCGPGETSAVRAEDFNWATSECRIPAIERGAGKNPARARWVHIPERCNELICPLPSSGRSFLKPGGSPFDPSPDGGSRIPYYFRKVRKAAGLGDEVVPYTLRHTWATWFYAQTKDYFALLDRGGWRKGDTARDYRKLPPSDLSDRLLRHGWDFRPGAGLPVDSVDLGDL